LDETFGFQFGEMLFDGFGGDSYYLSEFSGRIAGVSFEQLEDFLPTFSSFLLLFRVFLPLSDVGITIGITGRRELFQPPVAARLHIILLFSEIVVSLSKRKNK